MTRTRKPNPELKREQSGPPAFTADYVFVCIRAARLDEREACAQIADSHASCEGIAQRIAQEIREKQ